MNFINQIRQKKWIALFVIYLRYLIGGAYVFAAIVKIQGNRFTAANGEEAPIDDLLHFFETLYRSGLYWKFLGLAQLGAGFLLMTQRYATLGALVFLPISLNIYIITLSYNFHGTPYITGSIFLANIFLLLWDYERLLPLITNRVNGERLNCETNEHLFDKKWTITGVVLFTLSVSYPLYSRNPFVWFLICVLSSLVPLAMELKLRKLFWK